MINSQQRILQLTNKDYKSSLMLLITSTSPTREQNSSHGSPCVASQKHQTIKILTLDVPNAKPLGFVNQKTVITELLLYSEEEPIKISHINII